MFTDQLSITELENFHVTSLDHAISLLEFTKDENGLYFYDAGYPELWEACEGTVRQELQTMERFQPELPADGNERQTRYHHEIRVAKEAYSYILADILARPGYIPLAQLPRPQWKIDFANLNVENLKQALSELEITEKEDGTFFHEDEDFNVAIIDEQYCLDRLKEMTDDPVESDEGIDFYPYHNVRLWKQAYSIVLDEILRRSA